MRKSGINNQADYGLASWQHASAEMGNADIKVHEAERTGKRYLVQGQSNPPQAADTIK